MHRVGLVLNDSEADVERLKTLLRNEFGMDPKHVTLVVSSTGKRNNIWPVQENKSIEEVTGSCRHVIFVTENKHDVPKNNARHLKRLTKEPSAHQVIVFYMTQNRIEFTPASPSFESYFNVGTCET